MMRVPVTGVAGFTRRYMVDALTATGHEPIALRSDLTIAADVAEEMTRSAGSTRSTRSARSMCWTQRRGFAPDCHVVLASSAQVYGAQAAVLVREDAPTQPVHHYELSKLRAESGTAFFADRLRIAVTRPFNYARVDQESRYLLPKIVGHFTRRASEIGLGNTFVRRDFGDVRAVAQAYVGLVEAGAQGVFIVGVAWSIDDIRPILERRSGHSLEMRVNPAFRAPERRARTRRGYRWAAASPARLATEADRGHAGADARRNAGRAII